MFNKSRKQKTKRSPAPRRKTARPNPGPSRLSIWWNALDPLRRREVRKALVWSAVLATGTLCAAVGLGAMERSVRQRSNTVSQRVVLEIVDPPSWMPGALRHHLEATLRPEVKAVRIADLPAKAFACAQANPWVRSVENVRRCASDQPGTTILRLRATFRKPIARIRMNTRYAYLSADGVRLPALHIPKWVGKVKGDDGRQRLVCFASPAEAPRGLTIRPVHYVAIDGVRSTQPPLGQVWDGADVAAGLKLLSLIVDKPYANQITLVDVRNHGGRISRYSPHLKLYAQVGSGKATDIKFGRFPRPIGDSVVSPQRKIANLDEYVSRNGGQLAGLCEYLDLQQDQLHVSIN